jgi:integrase
MRLSEAAGLLKTDLVLDGDVPYVFIKPHSWRPLKTVSSQRKVPLVGASYWAACRITEYTSSEFCFPRYASKTKLKSNSASAALNKWIKTIAGKDAVIHGFRHSVRDRLREVNAPTDLVDQVGGWALQSIGQGYGDGYKLEQLHEWLSKISDQRI